MKKIHQWKKRKQKRTKKRKQRKEKRRKRKEKSCPLSLWNFPKSIRGTVCASKVQQRITYKCIYNLIRRSRTYIVDCRSCDTFTMPWILLRQISNTFEEGTQPPTKRGEEKACRWTSSSQQKAKAAYSANHGYKGAGRTERCFSQGADASLGCVSEKRQGCTATCEAVECGRGLVASAKERLNTFSSSILLCFFSPNLFIVSFCWCVQLFQRCLLVSTHGNRYNSH